MCDFKNIFPRLCRRRGNPDSYDIVSHTKYHNRDCSNLSTAALNSGRRGIKSTSLPRMLLHYLAKFDFILHRFVAISNKIIHTVKQLHI